MTPEIQFMIATLAEVKRNLERYRVPASYIQGTIVTTCENLAGNEIYNVLEALEIPYGPPIEDVEEESK